MCIDFIMLQEYFSVYEVCEYFIFQLVSDDIFGQVFVVVGKKLCGSLLVKKLFQEMDINQFICYLMDSCLFCVKFDDECQQVIVEFSECGFDLVFVVDKGELVGCLMEKEIVYLLEDDVIEDVQLQGVMLLLEKLYFEISFWMLWKKCLVWLLLLFVVEVYISSVLQYFEEVLELVIVLVFFILLFIGIGGNSGMQIILMLVCLMVLGEV